MSQKKAEHEAIVKKINVKEQKVRPVKPQTIEVHEVSGKRAMVRNSLQNDQ